MVINGVETERLNQSYKLPQLTKNFHNINLQIDPRTMSRKEWTLTQIADLLNRPQYNLIYLCEKGVIVPDGVDATGRGSSRRFSDQNLFEYMVAFTLSDFHIPTKVTTNLLLALRSFDKNLAKKYPLLKFPNSLTYPNCPEIKAILVQGSILYFSIEKTSKPAKYIGGIDLLNNEEAFSSSKLDKKKHRLTFSIEQVDFLPEYAKTAFFELNLSRIAREIPRN